MEELKTIFGKGPAMDDSTISDLTVRDIASTFTASQLEDRVSATFRAARKGTRPGHPYADVVFSFAFHQVIKALALDLGTEDFRPGVPTAAFHERDLQAGEEVRLSISVLVHDFVLVVIANSPEDFIPHAG